MKVAFVISSLSTDGPVSALLNYSSAFAAKDGVELRLITLNNAERNVRTKDFEALGAEVINLDPSKLGLVKTVFFLRNILRENCFDILMATCIRADFILMLAKAGLRIPAGTFVQNIPSEDLGFLYPGLKGKLLSLLHYLIIKKFDPHIVAVSDTVRARLLEEGNIRSQKILNPVLTDESRIGEVRIARDFAVYAASLSIRKNPAEALAFFFGSDCAKAGMPIKVYGEGPLEAELKSKYSTVSNLEWCGFSNDLPASFQQARVYISSSLSEGLPLIPQMALLNGCPCVLSDIPQHRELADLSSHVFLYKIGDSFDFQRAISTALNSNYQKVFDDASVLRKIISPAYSAEMLMRNFNI